MKCNVLIVFPCVFIEFLHQKHLFLLYFPYIQEYTFTILNKWNPLFLKCFHVFEFKLKILLELVLKRKTMNKKQCLDSAERQLRLRLLVFTLRFNINCKKWMEAARFGVQSVFVRSIAITSMNIRASTACREIHSTFVSLRRL
jgi:hypothetical protein